MLCPPDVRQLRLDNSLISRLHVLNHGKVKNSDDNVASISWDTHGIIFIDYLQMTKMINCIKWYWSLWTTKSGRHGAICKKKPVLFHKDNAPCKAIIESIVREKRSGKKASLLLTHDCVSPLLAAVVHPVAVVNAHQPLHAHSRLIRVPQNANIATMIRSAVVAAILRLSQHSILAGCPVTMECLSWPPMSHWQRMWEILPRIL